MTAKIEKSKSGTRLVLHPADSSDRRVLKAMKELLADYCVGAISVNNKMIELSIPVKLKKRP